MKRPQPNDHGQVGISLATSLYGRLGIFLHGKGTDYNYKELDTFIDNLEADLKIWDWIELRDGTTYTKTFTP